MTEILPKGAFIRDSVFGTLGEVMARDTFTAQNHPGYTVWLVDEGRMSHMFDGEYEVVPVDKKGRVRR